jgi:hypothetical protein
MNYEIQYIKYKIQNIKYKNRHTIIIKYKIVGDKWPLTSSELGIVLNRNRDKNACCERFRKSERFGIIGLLDIFGFESFPINSFEQL